MAYDLTINGFQALDLGHADVGYDILRLAPDASWDQIDIQYKWKGLREFVFNEPIEDCHDPVYLSQIIEKF